MERKLQWIGLSLAAIFVLLMAPGRAVGAETAVEEVISDTELRAEVQRLHEHRLTLIATGQQCLRTAAQAPTRNAVASAADRASDALNAARRSAQRTDNAAEELQGVSTLGDALRARAKYEAKYALLEDKMDELNAASAQANALLAAFRNGRMGVACAQSFAQALSSNDSSLALALTNPEEYRAGMLRQRIAKRQRREQALEGLRVVVEQKGEGFDPDTVLRNVSDFRDRYPDAGPDAEGVLRAAERGAQRINARAFAGHLERYATQLQQARDQARRTLAAEPSLRAQAEVNQVEFNFHKAQDDLSKAQAKVRELEQ